MNASGNTTETFYINRSILGWHLVPADPNSYPLLLQLLGGDQELVGSAIEWDSLSEGLKLIHSDAAYYGLVATICGNLKKRPTVKLRLAAPKPAEPVQLKVFDDIGGSDAAKWGVTDFYDEHEAALKAVIATGQPFDTNWYSVKKECQTARISRSKLRGPITIEVSVSMDDGNDLLDTAFWKAAGGNEFSNSGWDALKKIGKSDRDINRLFRELVELFSISDTSEAEFRTLHWRTGFDGICRALNAMADEIETSLEHQFESIVESCRETFLYIKEERGASCSNCGHFKASVPESGSQPAGPATCGQPKHHKILSVNKHFPFKNGCKYWTAKR